ncbi:type II toxin-antitoxin system RelE/ParE family toxin [bacterium]|nr:type II toxin-antitoxin system RelE/ParE family toxin [bacterium]
MNRFRIFETNQFLKDLKVDFSGRQEKIKIKLKSYVYPQLKQNPYFGKNIKKLRAYNPDTWRYRIGDYRFFYTIDNREKVVSMIAADTREDSYQN